MKKRKLAPYLKLYNMKMDLYVKSSYLFFVFDYFTDSKVFNLFGTKQLLKFSLYYVVSMLYRLLIVVVGIFAFYSYIQLGIYVVIGVSLFIYIALISEQLSKYSDVLSYQKSTLFYNSVPDDKYLEYVKFEYFLICFKDYILPVNYIVLYSFHVLPDIHIPYFLVVLLSFFISILTVIMMWFLAEIEIKTNLNLKIFSKLYKILFRWLKAFVPAKHKSFYSKDTNKFLSSSNVKRLSYHIIIPILMFMSLEQVLLQMGYRFESNSGMYFSIFTLIIGVSSMQYLKTMKQSFSLSSEEEGFQVLNSFECSYYRIFKSKLIENIILILITLTPFLLVFMSSSIGIDIETKLFLSLFMLLSILALQVKTLLVDFQDPEFSRNYYMGSSYRDDYISSNMQIVFVIAVLNGIVNSNIANNIVNELLILFSFTLIVYFILKLRVSRIYLTKLKRYGYGGLRYYD